MNGAIVSAFTFRTEGQPSPSHETLRVFVNGASAGLVTLRTDEALAFKRALSADAAAPDLLAALRECAKAIEEEVSCDDEDHPMIAAHKATAIRARAAIQKATA